jgi:Carboxypeptidase regulatory-like domain
MRFVLGSARVSLVFLLSLSAVMWAQTTGSITGTVHDSTGAVIANAQVTVSNEAKGISHTTPSNAASEYLVAGLGQGSYNITVTADGFKKFEAKGVILDVAQKSRVDVTLQVGAATAEITVEGTSVAQVETQSSDLSGTVNSKEISQLQLNGRNFTQWVTLVPGVSNQTGQDEGAVGVAGNVSYSINGGRTEYNNWELDGGDNMDNGSNTSLNVYPSLDSIGEVKVLTSNYGAQYGRSGSGTVEVETKSGTTQFHGDVYEFNRNTAYNARNYFSPTRDSYKKNDFGYTVGGPIYIPGVFNTKKDQTFFFWSEEWRKDRVPGQVFNAPVPSTEERTSGDFSALCAASAADCPLQPAILPDGSPNPVAGQHFAGDIVPFNASDPNVQALLALIPAPNSGSGANSFYNAAPIQPTNWREEVRVDHNITSNERLTFRYIHDSWDTINATPLWTNQGSFPTIQTNFKGPGVSTVARLSSTLSPTLLNEFVFSYTTDHIVLTNVGAWQRPANTTFGDLFGGNGGGIIPGINLISNGAYNGGFGEDPGYIPQGPYNSNPTYTYRDNMIKIVGKHNLQFGVYVVAAQKNEFGGELAQGSTPGYITFDASINANSTGNPFADLLTGNIYSFGQQSQRIKYYNRYKIVEPYFQDDFHVTSHLTLNLGLRLSLFGTYREEKFHQAFNFDPAHYVVGQTVTQSDGTVIGLTANGLPPSVTNLPNGIVQCGVTAGVPEGCMKGHLFNPAPRVGFAWDPFGDGKWAVRGGCGVFFEHTNGNEGNTESLENSPPLATTVQQLQIMGYQNIGGGTQLLNSR